MTGINKMKHKIEIQKNIEYLMCIHLHKIWSEVFMPTLPLNSSTLILIPFVSHFII